MIPKKHWLLALLLVVLNLSACGGSSSQSNEEQQQQQQLRDQGVYEPEEDTTNVVDEQKDADEEGEQDTDEEK